MKKKNTVSQIQLALILFIIISLVPIATINGQESQKSYLSLTGSVSYLHGEKTRSLDNSGLNSIDVLSSPGYLYGFQYGFGIKGDFSISSGFLFGRQSAKFRINHNENYTFIANGVFLRNIEIPLLLSYKYSLSPRFLLKSSAGIILNGVDRSQTSITSHYTNKDDEEDLIFISAESDEKSFFFPTYGLRFSVIYQFKNYKFLELAIKSSLGKNNFSVFDGYFKRSINGDIIDFGELRYSPNSIGFELNFGFHGKQ